MFNKVTKEEFLRFERIRKSGSIDMFDYKIVCKKTNLRKGKYLYIVKNYSKLADEFEIKT